MKGSIILSILAPIISAHTRFSTLFINSQSQGDGTCIRMDMDSSTTTNPITSITSVNMACGVGGSSAVNRTCPLHPGDSITLLHRAYPDSSRPGSIDPGHKGPTTVYMKKIADADSTDPYSSSASGDSWFKLVWNGYDESSKQWGTEKMIASDGKVEAMIPSDLPGGYYLIRSEVLSLHNVSYDKVYPQFFVGCAQVYVDSPRAGDVNAKTVSVPGYVDTSTSAMNYNIYTQSPLVVPFQEFGPEVYTSTSARTARHVVAGAHRPKRNDLNYPPHNSFLDGWSEPDADASNSTGNTTIKAGTNVGTTTHDNATSTGPLSDEVVRTTSPSLEASRFKTGSVFKSALLSRSTGSSTSSNLTSSIVGTCPSDTILTVGNRCLTEISSWSSDTPGAVPRCWAASRRCWTISQSCWDNISPAVNKNDMNSGCHAWEGKCQDLDSWCNDGHTEGPPAWNS